MKNLIAVFTLCFLTNAYSFEKYVCHSYDRDTETLTDNIVVLERTGKPSDYYEDGEWMGTQIPYTLSLYKGLHWDSEFDAKGTVLTEDVYFNFTSEDKKISFTIYLDEMEESSLKIKGQGKSQYFKCF